MSDTYQAIERTRPPHAAEALYVADEVDHVQWMIVPDSHEEPHVSDCEECGEVHGWRKVYVRV